MKQYESSRTIMIMAGGTGGHIFPGLAVAEYLGAHGWNIVWMGSKAGMETRLVAPKGYQMAWISMSGVRGNGVLRMIVLPLQLLIAFWQSARAIFAHRPDVVLGMGGYVSFPGGMMASFLNRPLAIHEQNSVAGLANKVLARLADRVLGGFPNAFGASIKTLWTGNPVRNDIAAIAPPEQRYATRSGPLSITVLGGSLGAQALNEIVPQALALLPAGERPQVTHQSGAQHSAAVQTNYERAGVTANIVPFISDMAQQYAQSDLMICRAGASTIAELAAAGVPAILVPFPYAVDDHQTHNARFLSERAAALLIPQPEFTPNRLAELLKVMTRGQLLEMAQHARSAGKPEATRTVAEACMELAGAA